MGLMTFFLAMCGTSLPSVSCSRDRLLLPQLQWLASTFEPMTTRSESLCDVVPLPLQDVLEFCYALPVNMLGPALSDSLHYIS
jgi:hypothetical protein